MPMPKYLRNLDGTAGKPRLSEGTMLSEGPVNDCRPIWAVSCKAAKMAPHKNGEGEGTPVTPPFSNRMRAHAHIWVALPPSRH